MRNHKEDSHKYPASLFIAGFFLNLIKYFWLLIPAIILLVVGIFVRIFLYIGICGLLLAVILSFVEQLVMRAVTLRMKDQEWKDAILSKKWAKNVLALSEEKIKESSDQKDDP